MAKSNKTTELLAPISSEFQILPILQVEVDETQPRKFFDDHAMKELTESVRSNGILQPIMVRPDGIHIDKGRFYKIVCGERRYRAAKEAGLKDVPAIIRELSDDQALEIQIIENLQRKDVHPMEEAVAFKSLMEKREMPIHEIALRVGKKDYYVRQRLKLNDLTEKWQALFYKHAFTLHEALQIAMLPEKQQRALYDSEVEKDQEASTQPKISLSSWTLEQYKGDLHRAAFRLDDITLDKKAGACTTCQFNTGNAALFPDETTSTRCTNVSCFKHKADIHLERELKNAIEDPEVILVNKSSGESGSVQKLKKEGHQVLKQYSDFSEISAPEKPDWEEYKEDYYDDEEPEEKIKQDFEKELADYEKDLAAFNKKIGTGKFKKAFIVDSSYSGDAGKYTYIELKKSGDQKAAKSAVENKTADASDIKEEIKRIQEREKLNKELDINKVHKSILEELEKNKEIRKPGIKHQGATDRAIMMYLLIHETADYSARDKIKSALSLPKEPAYNHIGYADEYFNGLANITDDQLAFMLRIISISKWGNSKTSGDVHKESTILRDIAGYSGIDQDALEKDQAEVAAKRADRAKKRIAALNAQLKEQQPKKPVAEPADSTASKKSARKKAAKS